MLCRLQKHFVFLNQNGCIPENYRLQLYATNNMELIAITYLGILLIGTGIGYGIVRFNLRS